MARKDRERLTWFGLPYRAQAGALLMALLAVFSIAHRTYEISPQDDPVSAFELQLRPLLHDLPECGAVGYVSDAAMVDDSPSFWEFLYLQYGLAPLIVVDSSEYPFVIGNFHGARWDAKASQLQLTLVKDYGNGLVLFRGPSR